MRVILALLVFLSTLGLSQNPLRQEQPGQDRIDGVIGDGTCGLSHTVAPGLGAAGCTRYCVMHGGHYILISGEKIYKLTGDPKLIDEYAGVPRTMIGRRDGDTFHLTAIASE